jgi:primosomal protein N' (replication factor Y) (superfamily II helicase)
VPDVHVVSVLPDEAAIGKSFHYAVPDELAERVRVGSQVRVQLHGRRVGGWVVEDFVDTPHGVELRPLESVRGWGPPPVVVELARWAAWRWAGPVSAFLRAGSAPRAVRTLPVPRPRFPTTRQSQARGDGAELGARAALGESNVSESALEASGLGESALGAWPAGEAVVVRKPPAMDLAGIAFEALNIVDFRRAAGASQRPEPAGVLLLLPSHDAARQMAKALRRRGWPVASLPDDWALARAGGCVVVGARNAAFAPLPALEAAIVFDAHDEAYHEERAPTWSAWEVVVRRARLDGAPCALVSPCPTLDVLWAGRLEVPSRKEERRGWPPIEVVDRRSDDPRTGLFSERVVSLLRWATEVRGRRVLCVLNRTGRVRLLSCAACGELARCEVCGWRLELDEDQDGPRLHCRRCGAVRPVVCARCGGRTMKALRLGVSRVREELEALVGIEVEEVWGKLERPAGLSGEEAASPKTAVAVGTEALLHRALAADVVLFLDFDSELLAPRMRAAEEAMALLARASRLVTRASRSASSTADSGRANGRVVVQTRMPDHPVLRAAVNADPGRLADSEAEIRKALELPPFSALATISGQAADAYGETLREKATATVSVSGPVDGKWSLRAANDEDLCNLLGEVPRPRGRLRVEVDPVRI